MSDKKYRYISFLVSPELESALRSVAVEQDRSVSWIIKKALEQYLGIKKTSAKGKAKPSFR